MKALYVKFYFRIKLILYFCNKINVFQYSSYFYFPTDNDCSNKFLVKYLRCNFISLFQTLVAFFFLILIIDLFLVTNDKLKFPLHVILFPQLVQQVLKFRKYLTVKVTPYVNGNKSRHQTT
jgi:hypothetical protein